MNPLQKLYHQAKIEGRICARCGWRISKRNWKKGYKQCPGCYDALKGVNVRGGCLPDFDEPKDMTGES
jgi:hypothetical protein